MKERVLIGCLLFLSVMNAQLKHPKASPFSTVTQEVGLTVIKVEYSRPAVRGRKIFGDLVPYGRIWRVGANESTKITFGNDVSISGNLLAQGTYALYAFPEPDTWEIAFHGNTTHWGDGRKNYDPKEDVLRIKIVPAVSEYFQENFLISFDNIDHNSLNMVWCWENTKIKIPIKVDTPRIMEAEIEKQIKEKPTAQTYYETARYYQEQGMNYDIALEYLNKAIDLGGDTYYFHRVKSLVEAALNDYDAAIASATKSMELAALQGKDEFVRMNKKNIAQWKRLLVHQD